MDKFPSNGNCQRNKKKTKKNKKKKTKKNKKQKTKKKTTTTIGHGIPPASKLVFKTFKRFLKEPGYLFSLVLTGNSS